jgi:hypothetical protein
MALPSTANILIGIKQTQEGRSLDALHSIPVHKLRAQAAATEALSVPETYPHFTPFVENKKQVRPCAEVVRHSSICGTKAYYASMLLGSPCTYGLLYAA